MAGGGHRAGRGFLLRPTRPRLIRTNIPTVAISATSSSTLAESTSIVFILTATEPTTLAESVSIKLSTTDSFIFSDSGARIISAKASSNFVGSGVAVASPLSPVANDERTTAITLTGISGVVNFDNTTATNNASDPTFIHAGFNSIFYKWIPTQNGNAVFQTGPQNLDGNTDPYIDTRMGIYTYSGSYTTIGENDDSPDDPNGNSSQVSFTATAGTTYYIVIAGSINDLYTDVVGFLGVYGIGPGYLSWNLAITDTVIHDDQILLTPSTIPNTPANISITVSDVTPGATITASIGVTTIGAAVVDINGLASLTPTVYGLSAGNYTITLTQNLPAATGTVQLIVLASESSDSFVADSGYPGHSAQKWRFYDPVTTVAYDFEINPDTWETPVSQRNLTSLVTTSIQGQPLIFEGNQQPVSWSWSGWINTQTQYDAFVSWYQKRYRIVLYDSLGRTMVLYITSFDPQPQIKNDPNPYLMRYTMTALIYSVA